MLSSLVSDGHPRESPRLASRDAQMVKAQEASLRARARTAMGRVMAGSLQAQVSLYQAPLIFARVECGQPWELSSIRSPVPL